MKKIILITVISLAVSIIAVFSFLFVRYLINYKYADIPFDKHLNYDSFDEKNKILKLLKYKVTEKIFAYDKDKYNIIFVEYPLTGKSKNNFENVDYWKKWLKKGRRLILYFNPNDSSTDVLGLNENQFKTIKINSKNKLLNDVDSLYINTDLDLNAIMGNLEPLVTDNDKIFIAKENYNNGEIIYISDFFIFSDKSIFKENNAVFLNNLLKDYFKQTIVFDDFQEFIRPKQKQSFLFKDKFPYLIAQILLLMLLFFLVYYKRFGDPVELDKYKKRTITGHLEAVGNFFQKSKYISNIVKLFDRYFMERLKEIIKFRFTNEKDLISEVKKRFDIPQADEKFSAE